VNEYVEDEQEKLKQQIKKQFDNKFKRVEDQVNKIKEQTKIEIDNY